jgi:hypothetical protein
LNTIHAKGTTGIKSQRQTDDATGAKLIMHKGRVTGSSSVTDDAIGDLDFNSTDDTAAEVTGARVRAIAGETHTSTARGSILQFLVAKLTQTALTIQMTIGDVIETIARLDINGLRLVSQDVATTATINQLSGSKAVVNLTGSTATSIRGIDSAALTKVIVIHNRSSAVVTLAHENASATAADRLKLPDSTDIEILPDSSAELFYSTADSRWKVKSGSGSGGGGFKVTAVETLTASGTIATSVTAQRQMRHVQGTGGATTISTTPFGTGGGWKDGTEILLVGNHDDNSVILTASDVAKGLVGDFETLELTKYATVLCVYSSSLDRWIARI